MSTTKKALRLLVASVGALTLGAGVLIGGAGSALAAPVLGNIDPDATGSIVIHKHEHQASATPSPVNPDGTQQVGTAPVAGVTFTVYALLRDDEAIDLADPAAWNGLNALTVNEACTAVTGGTAYTLGASVGSVTTGSNGQGTVALDSIGAYVVCETAAPATVTDQASPFIVTIPFPYDDGWLYDVNVYPKNAVTSVGKTINAQQGLGLGSLVEFPVTVRVPALEPTQDFTGFDVADTLDSRLTPAPATAGSALGVKSVTVAGTLLDAALYTVTRTGQSMLVSLDTDDADVQSLLKANAHANVVVTFQATVTSVGNGAIANTATAFVNNPADNDGVRERPGVGSPAVTTNWGDLRILKTDASTAATPLANAEFQVYAAATPYPATAAECAAATATGSPLAVGATATFVSDEDGVVQIAGLFVSDSVNPAIDNAFRCYVVVETKAPAGFVTPLAPNNARGVAVITGSTGTTPDLTVANTQQTGVTLPLTGAEGTAAMTVGGLLLIGVGSLAIVISRRRRVAA